VQEEMKEKRDADAGYEPDRALLLQDFTARFGSLVAQELIKTFKDDAMDIE
jgi:hypothetical protein